MDDYKVPSVVIDVGPLPAELSYVVDANGARTPIVGFVITNYPVQTWSAEQASLARVSK